MALKALAVLVLMVACAAPAHACQPMDMFSVGDAGVGLGWLIWMFLAQCAYNGGTVPGIPLWPRWAVPLGMLGRLGGLDSPLAIAVILYCAFPAHLAVSFFQALFERSGDVEDRSARLALYGQPLACILILGIGAKWALYAGRGGLREFLFMHFDRGLGAYLTFLFIGLGVLGVQLTTPRSNRGGR